MEIEEVQKEIVNLAREAVYDYVLRGKLKEEPEELILELQGRAGVFVTIKKDSKLRGCIGTIKPTQKNVAREIISNAISAADSDPRFYPVSKDELDDLQFSVDILGDKEPVSGMEELDPRKYGIIVKGTHQTGLLLPDLEGIDTPQKQIDIARKKAGIPEDESIKIYRFKVERYKLEEKR